MLDNISRNKDAKSSEKCDDLPKEVDLKYKVHMCLLSLNKKYDALEILETIKRKQRTVKINMALGSLSMEMKRFHLATIAFKDVLKECPLAIEAAENVLKLGAKVKDRIFA